MSPEQFVAIIGALTALVVAVSALIVNTRGIHKTVRANHALLNGRMGELLELTRTTAHAKGRAAAARRSAKMLRAEGILVKLADDGSAADA